MTQRLYEMLEAEFHESWNRIWIYGADERIDVSLNDRSFAEFSRRSSEDIITFGEIEEIAKRYFGNCRVKDGKSLDLGGVYMDFGWDGKRAKNPYFGHSIWIPRFRPPLDIEISTGNRGNFVLEDEQREKYFGFVKDMFEKFKENAARG